MKPRFSHMLYFILPLIALLMTVGIACQSKKPNSGNTFNNNNQTQNNQTGGNQEGNLDKPLNPTTDSDGDAIAYTVDNCPSIANDDQMDDDGDGVGNACDNCVKVNNIFQDDEDADGIGDQCEPVDKSTIEFISIDDDGGILVGTTKQFKPSVYYKTSFDSPWQLVYATESKQESIRAGRKVGNKYYLLTSYANVNRNSIDKTFYINIIENGVISTHQIDDEASIRLYDLNNPDTMIVLPDGNIILAGNGPKCDTVLRYQVPMDLAEILYEGCAYVGAYAYTNSLDYVEHNGKYVVASGSDMGLFSSQCIGEGYCDFGPYFDLLVGKRVYDIVIDGFTPDADTTGKEYLNLLAFVSDPATITVPTGDESASCTERKGAQVYKVTSNYEYGKTVFTPLTQPLNSLEPCETVMGGIIDKTHNQAFAFVTKKDNRLHLNSMWKTKLDMSGWQQINIAALLPDEYPNFTSEFAVAKDGSLLLETLKGLGIFRLCPNDQWVSIDASCLAE